MGKLLLFLLGICGLACSQDPNGFPWGERLKFYLNRTYGWQRFVILGPESGLDHILDEPKEWGRDPHTYSYRYSSAFGGRLVRNSLELGLGAALREDTRFKPSGARKFRPRLRHVILQAFVTSGGRNDFAYSRLGATVGGLLITHTWQPCPISAARFFEGVAWSYAGHLENSFLTEFGPDFKKAGKRLRFRLLGR